MASRTLVSVEEYLRTSYRPDCDYVDGEIVERNLGELDHSDLQSEIITYFRTRRKRLCVFAYTEQRVQVSPTRFRIPDVCVMTDKPTDQIFRTPPFIAIEILSKEDRPKQTQQRVDDYLKFGVRYIWVIDPRSKRTWVHTKEGSQESKD